MCGAKAPKPAPAPPVYEKVSFDEDVAARDNTRKRLKGAVNTRSSILSQGGGSGGKTMLGQ
jgi:hypothetical protein